MRTLAGFAVMVAFIGAVVVYQEHVMRWVNYTGSVIAGLGRGSPPPAPRMDLPSPVEAIAQGKAKGQTAVRGALQGVTLKQLAQGTELGDLVELAGGLLADPPAAASTSGPNGQLGSGPPDGKEPSKPTARKKGPQVKAVTPARTNVVARRHTPVGAPREIERRSRAAHSSVGQPTRHIPVRLE